MSLAERPVGSQLLLPIAGGTDVSRGRSVWLLSASRSDASALRRHSAEGPAGTAHPFMLLDLENGANAVRPTDILLLKTADRNGLDVLVDPRTLGAGDARGLAGRIVASFRQAPDGSVPRKSLDLGLVKFASNTRRRDRKGWSRNELESTIDVLLLREMADSARLTERLCAELLEYPELSPYSPLRPIALRMSADAIRNVIASEDDASAAHRFYRQAARGFAAAGIAGQSGISRRLSAELSGPKSQLDLWLKVGTDSVSAGQRMGFHMRRFSGMRLPLASFGLPDARALGGPLRHVVVGTVGLEPAMIASWIAKDGTRSAEASMTVRDILSLHGARSIDFVIDSELATLSGMAGRSARPGRREPYRLIPRSSTCELQPRFADTTFGRPASFTVQPSRGRRHLIHLQVLTHDTPPTSIEFLLPPP